MISRESLELVLDLLYDSIDEEHKQMRRLIGQDRKAKRFYAKNKNCFRAAALERVRDEIEQHLNKE